MKNKTVFDLDDTLIDFMNPFVSWHNEVYGTNLKKEYFQTYEFWKIIGCSFEESKTRVGLFMDGDPDFKPNYHAQSLVQTLSREEDLYIVSARMLTDFERTQRTVDKLFRGYFKDIILTDGFSNPNAVRKNVICKRLGARRIIEDSLFNALDCANSEIYANLLKQPWNKDLPDTHSYMNRVENLGIIEERERFKKPVLQ